MVSWLKDAVFYEIYPQSFKDSNGDGIGDIGGIRQKLDYVKSLGCNALWINPIYDSPFKDGGYDVRDYKKVAARYGTNEELYALFEEAHQKGIRVLLDLVPGHTSEEHAWFRESAKAQHNAYSARYIWTNSVWQGIADHPYIAGDFARDGVYMLNFFKCQPALNYGWKTPKEDWQRPIDDPDCLATREAMKDVCRFWLTHGCDGFRVDMADSLVKEDDADKSGTATVWRDILGALRAEFPEAAFVSEWCNPQQAICGAGFDMDFYLDHRGNGYNTLVRDYETAGGDHSFFKKDAGGSIDRFLAEYLPRYLASRDLGYISFFTCNHDTPRPSHSLSEREQMLADAFYLTMPGVPFIYYGDEIGMHYMNGLPTKEGGYQRTGTRTPMQWDETKNLGFSEAEEDALYLPVEGSARAARELSGNGDQTVCRDSCDDTARVAGYDEQVVMSSLSGSVLATNVPTVASQEDVEGSLLETVRSLIALRHTYPDLQADADFAVIAKPLKGQAFVYRRGGMLLAVNPTGSEFVLEEAECGVAFGKIVFAIGEAVAETGKLRVGPQAFAVLEA